MTIVELIAEKLLQLPAEKQQEVLNYVEALSKDEGPRKHLRSLEGIWANCDFNITADDIAEARREMWGNFIS